MSHLGKKYKKIKMKFFICLFIIKVRRITSPTITTRYIASLIYTLTVNLKTNLSLSAHSYLRKSFTAYAFI